MSSVLDRVPAWALWAIDALLLAGIVASIWGAYANAVVAR